MADIYLRGGIGLNVFDFRLYPAGADLAEEPGIGLAKPVDYVHDGGWSPPIPRLRHLLHEVGKIVPIEPRRVLKQESVELKEMIELHALWRRAA